MKLSIFTSLFIIFIFLGLQAPGQALGKWERIYPSPNLDCFQSVAMSENRFVGVGKGGLVKTSEDGVNWVLQDYPTLRDLASVVWTGSQFMAVGERGGIFTTIDGISWTERESGVFQDLTDVAWTGSGYVVCGEDGIMLTSPDGESWVSQTTPLSDSNDDFFSVVFGNGLLVALGYSRTIITSPNGVEWTTIDDYSGRYHNIVWSGSEFLANGGPNPNVFARSQNGKTWVESNTFFFNMAVSAIASGGGKYIVAGKGGILSSENGLDWVVRQSGSGNHWKEIVWTGQRFLAYSSLGHIASSTNGIDWTIKTDYVSGLSDLAYGNGIYVGINDRGENGVVTSFDGNRWFFQNSGVVKGTDIDWLEGRFVLADGYFIHTSEDGVHWESTLAQIDREPLLPLRIPKAIVSIDRGNGVYVAVGERGGLYSTTSDFSLWTHYDRVAFRDLRDVKWLGGQFVAVGSSGTIVTSQDGMAWTQQISGSQSNLNEVAYSGDVYVATGGAEILISSDGVEWELAEPQLFARVPASVVWTGEEFLVGGASRAIFSSVNGRDWTQWPLPTEFGTVVRRANGRNFLINGSQGIFQSSDGVNWSLQNGFTDTVLRGIGHWKGRYVAVGRDGIMLRSSDGLRWTAIASGTDRTLRDVVLTEKGGVAVGENGVLLTSIDGEEWNLLPPAPERLLSRVAFGDGKYVAVGEGIFVSHDGIEWEAKPVEGIQSMNDVSWSGAQFVAVGENSTVLTSADGEVWTRREIQVFGLNLARVASTGHQVVVLGSNGNVIKSEDSVVWNTIAIGTQQYTSDVIWTGREFVVIGGNQSIHLSDGDFEISKIPVGGRDFLAAVWTGKEIVAVGGKDYLTDLPQGILLRFTYPLPSAYLEWAGLSGLSPASNAPEDDPNDDGVSNLLAFALGISPVTPVTSADQGYFPRVVDDISRCMTFSIPSDRAGDVIYVIEESELRNSDSWQEVARKEPSKFWSGSVSVNENQTLDGRLEFSMVFPNDLEPSGTNFFRLRVELP